MSTKPAAPPGLAVRGRRFWVAVVTEYEISPAELEILAEACRSLDTIDALQAAVDSDGVTVPGSTGQTRIHPAVGEIRQLRLAVARLLQVIGLPAEEPKPATARAERAAHRRWARS